MAGLYNPTTGGYNSISPAVAPGGLGSAPGQIAMPNPAQNLTQQIPGLTGLNQNASSVINSQLMGQLSPDTVNAIRNATASQSSANGMPGTSQIPGTIGGNLTAQDIGQTSQQLQNQGIANYNSYVPTVSQTQTLNPETQVGVEEQNAVNAAAPNPTSAATYAQQLFQSYLDQLQKGPPTPAAKAGLADNASYYTLAGSNKMYSGPNPTI